MVSFFDFKSLNRGHYSLGLTTGAFLFLFKLLRRIHTVLISKGTLNLIAMP